MSAAELQAVLTPLALATNRTLDDDTWEVYHGALQDVALETLSAAADRLIASARFFPTVGEIRASCDRVQAGKAFQTFTVPALPKGVLKDDDPRLWYACTTCQDSGWAPNWCRGSVDADPKPYHEYVSTRPCGHSACLRMGAKGYGHEFMTRCACYTTNPTIRKRLDARKQYSES